MQLHFWLEETAYFKMPKGQQQELVGLKQSSLEKVYFAASKRTQSYHHSIDLRHPFRLEIVFSLSHSCQKPQNGANWRNLTLTSQSL